jgi:tRNA(Ile)-lysidine synthase
MPGLTPAAFGRLLRPLLPRGADAIAVAVSGGADSMALALLCRDWAAKHKIHLQAYTVDHGLRPESAAEARQVARWLKKAGMDCRILTWRGAKPSANRQEAAREARYGLLRDACAKAGIAHLLLAHHREDQAETLLLRALRGSGVDGLSAMQPARMLERDFILLRPLLDVPKADLVATLRKRGQAWIEDPSNANPAFARVRVRRALDDLAGGDAVARAELVAHLALTARNLARARAALDAAARALLRTMARVEPGGIAWLDIAPLQSADDEIALRALGLLLKTVGGDPLPPRLERLERLLHGLRGKTPTPATLHRCMLRPEKNGTQILVCREARHLPEPIRLVPGSRLPWDGRFEIAVPKTARGLTLAPLGRHRPEDVSSAIPAAAWPTLPAIWRGPAGEGAKLLAVPALGWGDLPPGLSVTFGKHW